MKVTLIGSGSMAEGLAVRLTASDHYVQIYGRNADKVAALADKLGVKPVEAAKAANADIIIIATPYNNAVEALSRLGDLSGRVVIDITNPLTPDFMSLSIGHSTSAAEEIARAVPGIRLVKAFNTVFAQVLQRGHEIAGTAVPVYVAADDAEAKRTVTALVRSLGFAPVDAGSLANARYLEPLGGLNIYFAYEAGFGTAIAPAWLKDS
ncbi:Pyrroline-5-carboxylate reductase [Pleomorphomonas sp. T1.2MG-36]|uniref:NADPH-dependent F420 reductase n=1 Tax=Pleomorphomonas sp. T1.2MG-36 TaxID=3041167 RepID=UPI002477ABB5|nr:NAD(P)-binding domain-containing protein [Pleomorphomonas sp. T1.2MG-36]CAI9411158.1 Pyrroline-5-carboxylate reductase [Pleomorphomonas sp. T1.2MG-36]